MATQPPVTRQEIIDLSAGARTISIADFRALVGPLIAGGRLSVEVELDLDGIVASTERALGKEAARSLNVFLVKPDGTSSGTFSHVVQERGQQVLALA